MIFQNRPESLSGLPRFAKAFGIALFMTSISTLVAPSAAWADGTKPFRAARLTYLDGEVHVGQANGKSQATAVMNMPLFEGSVVSAGTSGTAEIEFEDGSLVRLTPNSGLSLVNLSVDSSGMYQTRLALLGGLAYLELRAGTKYQFSLDAGGDVITPIENATVRVNFDEAPASVAVLDGSVHVATANGATADANAGQTVRIDADSGGGVYLIKQAIAPESWDQWNEERDEAAAAEAGSQTDARSKFAGDQGYGWSDLDANGNWFAVPGHGEIWQPDAAAQGDANLDSGDQNNGDAGPAFDPYGYGSWVWTPAGYTWASGYGWGWLPYRCGQWAYWDGFGWGWTPGYGCGIYGGYFYGVNIGSAPGIYRRPRRPIAGPNPTHPILRGRGGPVPVGPLRSFNSARTIAGDTVSPLQPIGGGYTPRGGSAIGWGMRKDYPVDRSTHEAITGVIAGHTAPVAGSNMRAAWQPVTSVNGHVLAARPVYTQPRSGYTSQTGSRSAPIVRQAPAPKQSAPAQHSAPAAAPASHASSSAPSSTSKGH